MRKRGSPRVQPVVERDQERLVVCADRRRVLTCSIASMWWLRTARLLTRSVPPPSLSLPPISPQTLRLFLNPRIGTSFRMSSPKRHQNTLNTRPPVHREMAQQALSRDAFKKRISVLAVSVPPEKASLFLKSQELKGCVRRFDCLYS